MKKYEYKFVSISGNEVFRIEEIINEYCKLGWRLYGFHEQIGISYVILEKEL